MNLLVEKSWMGIFFTPEHPELKFSGRLDYFPDKGACLNYLSTPPEYPVPRCVQNSEKIIHGVLESGERCTLLSPGLASRTRQFNRGQKSVFGNISFNILLVGAHVNSETRFSSASVVCTGMQDFFAKTGSNESEVFSPELTESATTSFGRASIFTKATFGQLPDNPRALFHSFNDGALQRLVSAIGEIEKEFPDAYFSVKKDLEYSIHLDLDPEAQIKSAREVIFEVAKLLALLTARPVFPTMISLLMAGSEDQLVRFYPTILSDKRTITMSLEKVSHFHLPINAGNVKFTELIQNWMNKSQQFRTVAESLQNQTGVINIRELHGEFVLNVALIESISKLENRHAQKEKFQYPVDAFSSNILNEFLCSELKISADNIGKTIGEIRNEIAHFGKPRKLTDRLKINGLYRVNAAIQLIVLGYILHTIGVPVSAIESYQNTFIPN